MKKIFSLLFIALFISTGCNVLSFGKEPKSNKLIAWIDDDGHEGFYSKLKPFAEEYKIPFTSAIITSRTPGDFNGPFRYMTMEQIKEMQELGCEFVSHGYSHSIDKKLTDMTVEELHEDLCKSKEIMKENGWNHNIMVYGFGAENEQVWNVTKEYYKFGIDVADSSSPLGDIIEEPLNLYAVPRVSVSVPNEHVFKKIDEAAQKETALIFSSHMDQGDWFTPEKVRAVIEYALSKGFEFVTVETILDNYVKP